MSFSIAVCGSGDGSIGGHEKVLSWAEDLGERIALKGCVLITGGRGGVMEAACKGAKKKGGTTIGILPGGKSQANSFVDIPLPTMMGERRNMLVVSIADCIIALSGRWGTLNEITFAVLQGKPVVFLKGGGGFVDRLLNAGLQEDIEGLYSVSNSPKDAVEQAIRFASRELISKH
jgi:uncharacterized protein (TIGR00725 family)